MSPRCACCRPLTLAVHLQNTRTPLKVKKKPLVKIGLIQKSDYDSVYTICRILNRGEINKLKLKRFEEMNETNCKIVV
jgi:hypothetical protein